MNTVEKRKVYSLAELLSLPNLAAEVISPTDLATHINKKVQDHLKAGIALVWFIYPQTRIVTIHRKDDSTTKLRANDELSGEDIVPGFRCKVSELFPVTGK